jgi:hypothetical protein
MSPVKTWEGEYIYTADESWHPWYDYAEALTLQPFGYSATIGRNWDLISFDISDWRNGLGHWAPNPKSLIPTPILIQKQIDSIPMEILPHGAVIINKINKNTDYVFRWLNKKWEIII